LNDIFLNCFSKCLEKTSKHFQKLGKIKENIKITGGDEMGKNQKFSERAENVLFNEFLFIILSARGD